MCEKISVEKFVEVFTTKLIEGNISFWVKKGESETLCFEFKYVESSGSYLFSGEIDGKPIVKSYVKFEQ